MGKADIAADITKPGEVLLELAKERAKTNFANAGVRIGSVTFYGKEVRDKRMFPHNHGFKLIRRATKPKVRSSRFLSFKDCMKKYLNNSKLRGKYDIETWRKYVFGNVARICKARHYPDEYPYAGFDIDTSDIIWRSTGSAEGIKYIEFGNPKRIEKPIKEKTETELLAEIRKLERIVRS